MFKRLREKIAEEANRFPVGQHSNNSGKPLPETEDKTSENTSEDLITLSDSSSVVVPHTSSQQFSIGEDEDGSHSEQSTPQKGQTIAGDTNSQNPQEPHSSMFSGFGFGPEYRPSKKLAYIPQSDIESEREDPPTLNLDGISKDQLLSAIQALKARSYKYKNKYAEVVKNYKELRDEKIKIENALIETQDKGSRRITELREQCQLEQKAKAHLEENLRLLLDEKDSRICVLETQINLLKDSGKSGSSKTVSEDGDHDIGAADSKSDDSSISTSSDLATLQEKVERLQHQHNQNKKTITAQTDQISLLRKQNESLSQELEKKVKCLNELQDEHTRLKAEQELVLKTLNDRLQELEKQQEENMMSMAETKKNMHLELEFKDKQLLKAEEEAKFYQLQAEQGKDQVSALKKEHEEKVNELVCQLEATEKMLEEEKQSLIQELAQGKAAAIKLVQQECSKKVSAIAEEWKSKYEALQAEYQKTSKTEVKELRSKLNQAELEIKELQSSIAVLEKEKTSLQNSVEKLESEITLAREKHAQLEVSLLDYENLKSKGSLLGEQETCNLELKCEIEKLTAKEHDLNHLCESLKKQLQSQINAASELETEKCSFADQIKQLELSRTELERTCQEHEKELSLVNETLKNQTALVESLSLKIDHKDDEIKDWKHKFESVQLVEQLLTEKLNLAISDGKNFEAENADLISKIWMLNTKTTNLENLLACKEKDLQSLSVYISESFNEIGLLKDTLDVKELKLKQLFADYKCIESLLTSVEQQQFSMRQTIVNFEALSDCLCKDTNYVARKFQQIENYLMKVKRDNENLETQPFCVNKSIEQKENVEKSDNIDERKEVKESSTLHDELSALTKENFDLKEELDNYKSMLESQNIEFAKNITILQQSLSELQEERNNLSLVLQNIENDVTSQKQEPNCAVLCETSMLSKATSKLENDPNWELKTSEVNSKVKSVIDALSLQTEIVNKELRNLQEQFKSNQDSFSEKLNELRARLLHRTELLLSTKEDLDASVSVANTLKGQLESAEQGMLAKTQLIHSLERSHQQLESKYKELKEKSFQKECDLKSAHNLQLSELRNQTKLVIDRLTEQVKTSEAALKEKEEEFSLKLKSLEERDQASVLEARNQAKEILICQTKISQFRELADNFEKSFLDPISKLESYSSKTFDLMSKIHKLAEKLKEKDEVISNKNKNILNLENQLKSFTDLQRHCSELQNELESSNKALINVKEELAREKEKLTVSEGKISKMKEEYKKSLQAVNSCSDQNMQEVSRLQISLASSSEELESTKVRYVDACSKINSLEKEIKEWQLKYDLLSADHKKCSQELSLTVSKIQCLNENFLQKMDVINKVLLDKGVKLDEIKSKISAISFKHKDETEVVSQLRSDLDSSKSSVSAIEVKLLETEKKLEESENLSTELKEKHNNLLAKMGEIFCDFQAQSGILMSNYDNHLNKVTMVLSDIGARLTNIESKFSKIFSKSISKSKEFSELKSQLVLFQTETSKLKSLVEQQKDKFEVCKDSAVEWKSKYDNAILQIKNLSLQHKVSSDELKQLLSEKENHLQDAQNKLVCLEKTLQNYEEGSNKLSSIQDLLQKSMEEVNNYQALLNEHIEKFTAEEQEKLTWKQKFENALEDLGKATAESLKDKEKIQQLLHEVETKSDQLKCMVTPDRMKEIEANHLQEVKKCKDQISDLKFKIKTLSQNLSEKEISLKMKEKDMNNLEAHHEESLGCMKDKLHTAEKNYKTQMEQLKVKLSQLEKENSLLLSEKENLLVVQSQFKEIKSKAEKLQAEVQSKDEELKKLQEKMDISTKEQICALQEGMKDKENMLLKLKANLESVNKERAGTVDELNKKIKHLEVEREQLMIQAQERVSATEAKCREDIKALQEKCNKLASENEEIEQLKKQIQKLNSQLDESLLVAESNQASALNEVTSLKEKLADAEAKIAEIELSKSTLECELSSSLTKLEHENKELKSSCDDVKRLKAEKEELNEKLKAAIQVRTRDNERVSMLENERDCLKAENEKLSKGVKTLENESISVREKLRTLEANEAAMKKHIEDLTAENEKLKSEILDLKKSFEKEKQLLLSANSKLESKIQHLESSDLPVKDYVALLRKEYEEALKAKDDEVLGKLKQLVRDFSLQMDLKDKDSEQMIAELMEKNQYLEETLSRDHALELSAVRQDLFEKDCALQDMRDSYEEALKEKEAIIKKLELTIKSVHGNEDSSLQCPAENATEPSDWDDTWVVPDEVVSNSSPVHNHNACEEHVQKIETLEEELSKSNAEIKELKVLLRLSPPETMMENNNRRASLQSIPEPTEFEYLKNIIYEYMMGKEPVTLAKVIAAVLRFNDTQTQQVIKREEARHSAR